MIGVGVEVHSINGEWIWEKGEWRMENYGALPFSILHSPFSLIPHPSSLIPYTFSFLHHLTATLSAPPSNEIKYMPLASSFVARASPGAKVNADIIRPALSNKRM